MGKIYHNILELIGNTPLLEINGYKKLLGTKSNIFAKLESFNPSGSVKDRIAKAMIEDFEKQGKLKSGGTIIEPTSGNTGIGIAMAASSLGYKCIIVMPDSMSIERRKVIYNYGAKIVLTDGKKGMAGANEKAKEILKETDNAVILSQFENPINPLIHYLTTGPEIYNDLDGNIDCFIAGIGTGGTISGVSKYLKEKNKDIKVFGIEPKNSSVLSNNIASSHKIQGIGAGFIPKTLDTSIYDHIIQVDDDIAFEKAKTIFKTDGVSVGISSGAALAALEEVCSKFDFSNIVVLFPDGGDRYYSTPLFD